MMSHINEPTFKNRVQEHVRIGFIFAKDVEIKKPHPVLDQKLSDLLERRKADLSEDEDEFRKACRDMLRIGSYKPTGRGKPASEYLLRSARDSKFPRINTVVDINNYISLKYLVPVSLWDIHKAKTDSYIFKTGEIGESFIFNKGGQIIDLHDLVTGFVVRNGMEIPIVNPIKDSLQTKTDSETNSIGAAIYYPAGWFKNPALSQITDEFSTLLTHISKSVSVSAN
ncbi:MAG: phenylalanine--tRNA ligase beta subunit-related protein [Balneolaceae bacterium]